MAGFRGQRLEFGEHAQHVQEALPGGSAGVDRLFSCPQRSQFMLHGHSLWCAAMALLLFEAHGLT
jgi:hypothetical protein